MTRTKLVWLEVAVAAALVAAPAAPGAPAHGAERRPQVTGATCALVSYGGPDGTRSGLLTGGPWQATEPGAVVTNVTCSVQLGVDDPAAQDVVRASGAAGYLPPTPVTYRHSLSASAFVCTEVTVSWPPEPPTVVPYDADPERPGPQCRRATRTESQILVVDIAPSDPTTWWCVRAEHGLPPYGYQEVCNPFA